MLSKVCKHNFAETTAEYQDQKPISITNTIYNMVPSIQMINVRPWVAINVLLSRGKHKLSQLSLSWSIFLISYNSIPQDDWINITTPGSHNCIRIPKQFLLELEFSCNLKPSVSYPTEFRILAKSEQFPTMD